MANTKVTSGVIKDDAVGADQLASNSVVTASINDNAITTAKIADDAILTAKISNSAITNAKMSSNSVDSDQYVDGSIDTAHIGDGQVTSAKLDTNIAVSGTLTVGSHLSLGDNDKIKLGAGEDLQIYHDGTHSYIDELATGDLRIRSNSAIALLKSSDNADMLLAVPDGAVSLYYAGSKKFETASGGVTVTGDLSVGTVAAGSSTATPVELNLGSTFADAAGSKSKMKLKLFEDTSSNILGFGISNAALEYHTNGVHTFYKDESEKMRIDGSGNLLLGTTTFNNLSTESGVLASNNVVMARGSLADHQDACAVLQYSSDTTWLRAYGDTAGSGLIVFRTGGGAGSTDTERMRIHSSGCVGVGSTTDRSLGTNIGTLVVNGSAGGGLWLSPNDSSAMTSKIYAQANGSVGDLIINNGTGVGSGGIRFQTNESEKMLLESGGDLTVGTSSAGFHFDVSTQLFSTTFGTGGNLTLAVTNSSGSPNGGEIFLGGSTRGDSLRNCIVFRRGSGTQSMLIDASGNVTIAGSLSKGSGSFKIDHPLESKKETHHLVHSFIEGPQADNIYRGKVNLTNGTATVNIDIQAGMTEGTFVALNTNVQCFTTNETDWDSVKGTVSGNTLTITCKNETSTATVSWLVIGERHDQHMLDNDLTDDNGKVIVEPSKESK